MTDSAQFWATYPALDYTAVLEERRLGMLWISQNPQRLPALLDHYRHSVADFISDWGVTLDTREVAKGRAALVPFILTVKQRELVNWTYERWRRGENGTVVKSRDVGASWCEMALAASLAVLERNFVAGIVSATEVKLDRVGDPDTLMFKAREFLKNLPVEFQAGYLEDKHSSYMRIVIPGTGSTITAEAGENAGRGGRKAIVFCDESAHFQHPKKIDAALAATTPCRIDLSSVNGMANSFYERAHNSNIPRFDITWRDDPRRDLAWYEQMRRTHDALVIAQEYDCDFSASTEGQLISPAWINAAIGAAERLGIEPSGERRAGFDVADEGRDQCAVAVRCGVAVRHLEAWSGKGSNISRSVQRAAGICEQHGCRALNYDGDGLGSGVRGVAVDLNAKRVAAGKLEIEVTAFRGSGAVVNPDGSDVEGRLNRDFFANAKAQDYWRLRGRFETTARVVEAAERGEPIEYNVDEIVSIDSALPLLNQLVAELAQIRWLMTAAGKVLIDKQPDNIASPNLADSLMIAFALQSGAYFSGVRTVAAGPSVAAAPVMPMWFDKVFASLVIMDEVAAVVYCAANDPDEDGQRGIGCWVLDYDLVVLGEGCDAWLMGIDEHLQALKDATVQAEHAVLHGTYLDDLEEGWAAALAQLGVVTNQVGEDLPPLAERYNKSKPYTTRGLVAIGPVAARKELTFKGSGRRNFLREVVTASAPPESSVLALSFATAVLLTYRGRESVPTPTLHPQQFARPPKPPPPPPPSTKLGTWLRKGVPHVVDGRGVFYPYSGVPDERDDVFYELAEGQHVINNVIAWVHPAVGARSSGRQE